MNYSVMDDKIFEFVYVSAMRDATLQQSFSGKKAWMTDCNQFIASTKALKALVSDVIKGDIANCDSYNERFLGISIKVCDDINLCPQKDGDGFFTFGNAQKLINIVMKYFYLHSFGNEEEKANFRFCHCPMDQQLLEEVWSRRTELCEDTRKALGKRVDFLKSWGNEDFSCNNGIKVFPERYKVFQKAVTELSKDKSPLEFDYFVWGNEN
jgi:hypothetical protein